MDSRYPLTFFGIQVSEAEHSEIVGQHNTLLSIVEEIRKNTSLLELVDLSSNRVLITLTFKDELRTYYGYRHLYIKTSDLDGMICISDDRPLGQKYDSACHIYGFDGWFMKKTTVGEKATGIFKFVRHQLRHLPELYAQLHQ